MFSNISWSEYLTFISVSALIWYAFVLYTYYRHDLFQTLQGKKIAALNNLSFGDHTTSHHQSDAVLEIYQPKEAESVHVVQAITDEIQAYLEEAGKNEVGKEDLVTSLTRIVSKYPSLVGSDYKDSLDDLLKNEAELNCAVSLSESEISRIWSGS
jgi:hypothetical protein